MSPFLKAKYMPSGYPCAVYMRAAVLLLLIVFSLVNRLFANSILPLPAIPAKGSSMGNGDFMVVKITYNNDFAYSKNYEKRNIKGCYKAQLSESNVVLRCREYVSVIRPGVVWEKWLKLQQERKYFTFSIDELGILKTKARIISMQPASWFVKKLMKVKKGNSIISGVLIRHTLDVRRYGFRKKGSHEVDYINATKNHPFYVKGKGEFVPAGQLKLTDTLISKDGYSIFPVKIFNDIHKYMKVNNKPKVVYNMELYSKHVYFVGSKKILVHNTCILEKYFKHLLKSKAFFEDEEKSSVWILVPRENMTMLALNEDELQLFNKEEGTGLIPRAISNRIKCMGFEQVKVSLDKDLNADKFFLWKLDGSMSMGEYKKVVPYLSWITEPDIKKGSEHLMSARYKALIHSGNIRGVLCTVEQESKSTIAEYEALIHSGEISGVLCTTEFPFIT